MSQRFVAQPYDDGFHLRDFFDVVDADHSLVHLDVVVAWVKRTGLLQVETTIEEFRRRGGTSRVIAGISQGGTSKQGLAMLLDLTDEAFVFHNPGRTFHPKIYAVSGQDRAVVLVGSHNLTRGGVTANYEAGTLSELDLTKVDDRRFLSEVDAFIERLIDDAELCVPLNSALLGQLESSPRYRLSDEDAPEGAADPIDGDAVSDAEGDIPGDSAVAAIFGSSRHSMRPGRRESRSSRTGRRSSAASDVPAKRAAASRSTRPDPVVKRWFKPFGASDAQQLPSSNRSNTMTLVRNRHPMDASDYFRTEFFASETWTPSRTVGRGQPREVTTIECEVLVRGVSLETQIFEVRHTPGYDAGQANRTTELRWLEFGTYLRANPLTGLIASLEKTASGHYRLVFDDGPTGPFLY